MRVLIRGVGRDGGPVLTQRRADILNLVIDEYIDTAAPVSSRALVDRHNLDVSTATVRNELAALEEEGYITHPYTSAGRIPSNSGYRFYVERLMAEEPIGADERRTIEHQFYQAPPDLDEWLELAASILAAAVGNVAVVSRPQRPVPHLRQAQLVHLRPGAALLVGVLDDGSVQERIVAVPEHEDQADLLTRAARINDRLSLSDSERIRAVAPQFEDDDDRRLALEIADLVAEGASAAQLFIDGIRKVLEQPEFSTADRMLDAVQHLEAYELRGALRTPRSADPGARVLIGDENERNWLHDWTLVISAFGEPGGAVGSVAVLGPTRMHYGHTIPRVRYFARLMTELLHELDG
ncbi:MAG: heat-inducible transcription repressor HrcA [Chloroflexi bacterium]|nr:heat-inducible transcription repressor HrcA [Chloroflexota bacterium]